MRGICKKACLKDLKKDRHKRGAIPRISRSKKRPCSLMLMSSVGMSMMNEKRVDDKCSNEIPPPRGMKLFLTTLIRSHRRRKAHYESTSFLTGPGRNN